MNSLQGRIVLGAPDVYQEVFLLHPETLHYEISSKNHPDIDCKAVSGMASLKERGFSAFYKYRNSLWVAFDSRVHAVTDAVTSNWSMESWKPVTPGKAPVSSARRFGLIDSGTVVEERNYAIVENNPDTRPFVIWDDEDEDFLLWMHNVLHSPERRALLFETWK